MLIAIFGGLSAIFAIVMLGVYIRYRSQQTTRPVVLIHAPLHGDSLEVGQVATLHATARDESKIVRLELWENNQLVESEASNLSEGISPFPMLVNWQPTFPGNHTLIVRAFNSQGERAQASINVEAIETPDQDKDGTADEVDLCPTEAGSRAAEGCPDRDGDGFADSEDTCIDDAGPSEGDGCPAPSEGDRDGDGSPDETDICPDEVGPRRAEGCPDADGDIIADHEDACPDEAGWIDHDGCPTPGDSDGDGVLDGEDACPEARGPADLEGCPDTDRDGLGDAEDACPSEPGGAGTDGCPDTDSDGLPDSRDLCPDDPGPAESGGCPDTGAGDRDSDGVPDDVDLADDEPGLPEHGGAPRPGEGADDDDDGIPDAEEPPDDPLLGLIPGFFLDEIVELPVEKVPYRVEIQVLEFTVSADYDEVSCYASAADEEWSPEPVLYGPFEPAPSERQWLFEFAGGDNSRTAAVDEERHLEIYVECQAYATPPGGDREIHYNLGRINERHPPDEWKTEEGRDFFRESVEGETGHFFEVNYRLCSPGCDPGALPAPWLRHFVVEPGHQMRTYWDWDGELNDIDGFRVYIDGSLAWTKPKSTPWALFWARPRPACGEIWEVHMTAYSGFDSYGNPIRESPPSNTVLVAGVEECQRIARVTFSQIQTYDVPEDRDDHDFCAGSRVGPISGSFLANEGRFRLQTGFSRWFGTSGGGERWLGVCLYDDTNFSISDLSASCRSGSEDWDVDSTDFVHCPTRNYVEALLDPDDDLYIQATITETDPDGTWYWLFAGYLEIGPAELEHLMGGGPYTYGIRDDYGYMDMIIEVEILPYEP
jgi:hypothetical protein